MSENKQIHEVIVQVIVIYEDRANEIETSTYRVGIDKIAEMIQPIADTAVEDNVAYSVMMDFKDKLRI